MKNISVLACLFLTIQSYAHPFFHLDETNNGFSLAPLQAFHPDFLWSSEQKETVLNALNNDLENFQQSVWDSFAEFVRLQVNIDDNKNNNNTKNFQNLHRFTIATTRHHPLFLLSECGLINKSKSTPEQCPLRRMPNKNVCPRERFMNDVLAKLPEGPQSGVIFYGSGGSFFETQLLSRMLEKPNTHLTDVYFIDPEYSAERNFTAEHFRMFNEAIGNGGTPLADNFNVNTLRRIYRSIQIAYFIWAIKPDVKFHYYASQENYTKDVLAGVINKADALISMDAISGTHIRGLFLNDALIKREWEILQTVLLDNSLVAWTYRISGIRQDVQTTIFHKSNAKYRCANCLLPGDDFSHCGQCKAVFYCGRKCQVADWPKHKTICKK